MNSHYEIDEQGRYAILILGSESRMWKNVVDEFREEVAHKKIEKVAVDYHDVDAECLMTGGVIHLIHTYMRMQRNGVDITNCNMDEEIKRNATVRLTKDLILPKEGRLETFIKENT